ncbi:V0D/AC39 family V-type ATPase subunit [Lacrimispora aerotolerans]|uniref:V0D/AC39 family V-type ATPase subunit n=1 Tax=Lacrimispora aerotolerans TaxID=36832 RepID=UPI00047C9FBA|nr:V-type ATPase subunit [Lacrimispora aerotolerans]
MGDLLSYSGITTKVRAMESHLISENQFREMAGLSTVAEAVDYLGHLKAYDGLFTDLEGTSLHRGAIEQKLILSLYKDFAKLYRFANLNQRKFLDLYFMHFEIDILKKSLRNAIGNNHVDIDLSVFEDFFKLHSKLDLIKLSASRSLSDFLSNLEGSIYYDFLSGLSDSREPTLFDYEVHLDLLYFKSIWKVMGKHLKKEERELLSRCFGSKLDLLNIQWIYRSKKYYNLQSTDIYSLLIPTNYHLNKEQITKMAEAGSIEEFYGVLKTTYYGRKADIEVFDLPDLEKLTKEVLDKIYRSTSQQNPYSIATLNSYLYFKEAEIQKVITLIESIRYRLSPDEIISYVENQ